MRKMSFVLTITVFLVTFLMSACGSIEEKQQEGSGSSSTTEPPKAVSSMAEKEYTLEDWIKDNDPNGTILSVDSVSDVSGNTIIIHSEIDIDPSMLEDTSLQETFLSIMDENCGNGSELESVAKEAISNIEQQTTLSGCKTKVVFYNKVGDEIYVSEYDANGFCDGWLGEAIPDSFSGSEKASSSSTGKTPSSSEKKSSSVPFTNKYGNSTTKCAHPGCNNYIASSGDTNCCTVHSNKCMECGKYIDEDATWCMDCLTKAASSSSSSGSSSSGSSYGSSGSSSAGTEKYPCMGKNDTCPNYTYSPYDFYCSSCDPDGDNVEG